MTGEQESGSPEELDSAEKLKLQRLIEACKDVLEADNIDFMRECDFGEALGYAYGRLLECGIDSDVFLAEHDILEPEEKTE